MKNYKNENAGIEIMVSLIIKSVVVLSAFIKHSEPGLKVNPITQQL